MKVEEYEERKVSILGWDVNLTTYRLGEEWHAKADNVSPGATLCRASGATRDDAVSKAMKRAEELVGRTKRREA